MRRLERKYDETEEEKNKRRRRNDVKKWGDGWQGREEDVEEGNGGKK